MRRATSDAAPAGEEPRVERMARAVRSKAGASGLAVLALSLVCVLGSLAAHWSYSESYHARHGLASSRVASPNSQQVPP
jgi:hypothetical protein